MKEQTLERQTALAARLSQIKDDDSLDMIEEVLDLVSSTANFAESDRLNQALEAGRQDIEAGRLMSETEFYSVFEEAVDKGMADRSNGK